jgi:DNA polymerase (family 10)
MREAAARHKLAYLGIAEHSQHAVYAHGLDDARVLAQRQEILAMNASSAGCVLLPGVESDILADGALDFPPATLQQLDVVIASVHSRMGHKREEMTARVVAAAKNPWTDIIGHPTGRLILGRAPADYDVDALIEACAQSGCAVELNANPARLDLDEKHLAKAKERGVMISIAADAHSAEALGHLEYGVIIARRAGLTPDDVLNAKPLPELRAWLSARRARAQV